MLKVLNLSCLREEKLLFSDLTFELLPGTWVWIKGSNGSGKSSLLEILAGLLPFEEGEIVWKNRRLYHPNPDYLQSIHHIGHKFGIQLGLSPEENIKWYGDIRGTRWELLGIRNSLFEWGLRDFLETPCAKLSMGQRQRVALAALQVYPSLLWLLDEPLSALDNKAQQIFACQLAEHLLKGGMAIIASHSVYPFKIPAEITVELCDYRARNTFFCEEMH